MRDANLLNCPTYKIEDRKNIVARVLGALLADPDCRYAFHGRWSNAWVPPTADELANGEARETLVHILRSFPVTCDKPDPCIRPHQESNQEPTQE